MYEFTPAKINIGLYITNRRADGYHDLETVFYAIPLNDTLEINVEDYPPTRPYSFQQTGIQIEGKPEDNLVVRVYLSMREEFNFPPVHILLDKHIPTGAGLGGGSSDAAMMMKMLNTMFKLNLSEADMEERLASFGADCSFFVKCKPIYATGIGNVFSPAPSFSLKGWNLVLIKPGSAVSTREAYSGIRPQKPEKDLREALSLPIEEWRDCVFNDFEKTIFISHPEIAAIKATLYDMGATYASMSGSGSAVYGIFKHIPTNVEDIFKDCFVFKCALTE